MEITKEKLIECGFKVFAKYGDNYQMDTFINGSYIRVDFVNGKFRATTDELQRDSFINVPTFARLNALVYGITGEWLEENDLQTCYNCGSRTKPIILGKLCRACNCEM